jgi:hypothetical protein
MEFPGKVSPNLSASTSNGGNAELNKSVICDESSVLAGKTRQLARRKLA